VSSFGTGIAGLVGGVVLMMGLFAFAQRRWVAGLVWLLGGMALIALLTFLDKPGSDSLKLGKIYEMYGRLTESTSSNVTTYLDRSST
jgi:uncharacterized membrane protein (GlpM family)